MNNNRQTAGDNSQQIIGNKNVIFNFFRKNDSYKILSDVIRGIVDNIDGELEMDIDKSPLEILEKIEYNNIMLHKDNFIEFIPYLPQVEYIIENLYSKKSEIVINRIKYNWSKVSSIYSEECKDRKLYELNELLIKKVDRKTINKYTYEIVEIAIDLIIFYSFTKCQILDNPN